MKKIRRYELTPEMVAEALAELPGWQMQAGKLHKRFEFGSFAAAMGWMMGVAIVADRMDHHPEWCNVYHRVDVFLVTHDMDNGISSWDVALAHEMEALAGGQIKKSP